MPQPERLDDQWESRDRPLLLELARRFADDGRTLTVDGDEILAVVALTPTFIDAKIHRQAGGEPYIASVFGLTERGRRETGLWPNQEAAADALVELLGQAADQVEDEDDAGALRKAGRALGTVSSAVLAEVTAALIRQQTGLP